jgi:hypothetical protein
MLHSRVLWKVHSKDHPVAVAMSYNDTLTEGAIHHSAGRNSDIPAVVLVQAQLAS